MIRRGARGSAFAYAGFVTCGLWIRDPFLREFESHLYCNENYDTAGGLELFVLVKAKRSKKQNYRSKTQTAKAADVCDNVR